MQHMIQNHNPVLSSYANYGRLAVNLKMDEAIALVQVELGDHNHEPSQYLAAGLVALAEEALIAAAYLMIAPTSIHVEAVEAHIPPPPPTEVDCDGEPTTRVDHQELGEELMEFTKQELMKVCDMLTVHYGKKYNKEKLTEAILNSEASSESIYNAMDEVVPATE